MTRDLDALPDADDPTPRYRAGAVARMLGMPVATLRIWEQRYHVSRAATAPSGHRLYSDQDVRRLALLRHLSELGHAIGTIAAMDDAALQAVARTHARTLDRTRPGASHGPWRLVVVGESLVQRLRHPTTRRQLGRPVSLLATPATLAEAQVGPPTSRIQERPDLLLVQLPGLQPGLAAQLQELAARWQAPRVAVVYGFAAVADVQQLDAAGVPNCRDPIDSRTLTRWLSALAGPAPLPSPGPAAGLRVALEDVPPRRFDDALLADFANISSTIACECPRHVATLLMQLTQFESYSAACISRSPADAALHAYLQQVTGVARAHFEQALARVAAHEGLTLGRSVAQRE